jgi:hypothetical protein
VGKRGVGVQHRSRECFFINAFPFYFTFSVESASSSMHSLLLYLHHTLQPEVVPRNKTPSGCHVLHDKRALASQVLLHLTRRGLPNHFVPAIALNLHGPLAQHSSAPPPLITRKIHPRKNRTTLNSWCPGSEASAKPENLERRENETLVIHYWHHLKMRPGCVYCLHIHNCFCKCAKK